MTGFSLETTIPDTRILDLLCAAFEGGIGYWARISHVVKRIDKMWSVATPAEIKEAGEAWHRANPGKREWTWVYWIPLADGFALMMEEEEAEGSNPSAYVMLNREEIAKGLRVMANLPPGKGGHHWQTFMEGREDAETGDVFIQCCVFGQIKYG
jgi:hypothetical protein